MANNFEFYTVLKGFHVYYITVNQKPCKEKKVTFKRKHKNPHYKSVVAGKTLLKGKVRNNSNWLETLPEIELTYVLSKKKNFSNYQIYFWTITESSSSKQNLLTIVTVSLFLRDWRTIFTSIGICQIESVFYKSSYPTPNIAHTISKKHLQNSRIVYSGISIRRTHHKADISIRRTVNLGTEHFPGQTLIRKSL